MKLQLLQFNVAYADVNANEHKIKHGFRILYNKTLMS